MAKSTTSIFYGKSHNQPEQRESTRKQAAKGFVKTWSNDSKGREDADRQTFWNDLLQRVYGINNYYDFITYEKDVQVKADGKVTTRRIDGYIPSTKTMIEMKGKNIVDLSKPIKQSGGDELTPYEQAKRYANFLPANEYPRWILVSNFHEIDIHDMNDPLANPTVINLKDLPDKIKSLEFMVDANEQRIINEKQISVDAGNLVAKIYDELAIAYEKGKKGSLSTPHIQESLNMLIVRLVFLLYADDTGILGERDMFQRFIERRDPDQIRDGLIQLFKVLDQDPDKNQRNDYISDEFKQFKYVNGGMFSDENIVIPQFTPELKELILNDAGKGFDWSNISPTIFGAVFESTLNPETRRSGGMHYTSIENIHKVIDPLFLNDLRDEFDKIQNMANVNQRKDRAIEFQEKIGKLKFFDPACGSGNFLTETYLSLRKMENECLKIIYGNEPILATGDIVKVHIQNFYGIEINDFAVSVARTAMWIAESQMLEQTKDTVYYNKDFLPLDSNDSIYEGNALRMDWSEIIKPYELNYIMGNPPFVGLSSLPKQDKELKDEQTKDMDIVFGNLPKHGKLDYVSAWYEKATHFMQKTTIQSAFVSTNSITQGEQPGILWKHLFNDRNVKITFAYRSFVWDNEAAQKAHVHCVIVGFTCSAYNESPIIFNESEFPHEAKHINGYLIDYSDVYIKSRKKNPPYNLPEMHKGSQPTDGGGLTLKESDAKTLSNKYPQLKSVIKPYLGSSELIKGKRRYCLWLKDVSPSLYRKIPEIKQRLDIVVNKRKQSSTDSVRLEDSKTPYLFTQIRQPNTNYIAVPEVSSENREYIPIGILSKNIIASNKLYLLPTDNKWLFAILSSSVHMAWMRAVAGRMKSDYSYSPAVYTNFPWLQFSDELRSELIKTAQGILNARKLYPDSSLADLYDPLTMPAELCKAHEANDKAVLNAYGLKPNATEEEIVQHLFKMYKNLTK